MAPALVTRYGYRHKPFLSARSQLETSIVVGARISHRRFGKGRHRARLNLGDCCSYALARHAGEPLLYKGDDFSHTDIPAVSLPGHHG